MKFLVIGSGGREHAIVKALKTSATSIDVIPGNAGIAQDATCHELPLDDTKALQAFLSERQFDCVVIGPEGPLAQGLSDIFRQAGLNVFGPSKAAARLEASKIFAKEFMVEAGVPTSAYQVVSSVEDVRKVFSKFTPPYVLKADGLAAGKGVFICKTEQELVAAARDIFEKKTLGSAGLTALLEQFQPGYELSYLILTNGSSYEPLPLAQDHKRLKDSDEGPNTGGMGVVAPIAVDSNLHAKIHEQVLKPTVRHLEASGLLYCGVVFIGLMITENGPTVLEYNVRFGDPEIQTILPLLDGDWAQVFNQVAKGQLPPLRWKNLAAACVVLAAEGYPESPRKHVPIEGDLQFKTETSYFLHAGTSKLNGQVVVNGGRVLNAMGLASTLREAVERAYTQARRARWPNLQMRSDIGAKVLSDHPLK